MLSTRSLQAAGGKAAIVGGLVNGVFLVLAAPLPAMLPVHAWLDHERPKAIAGGLMTAAFLAGSAYSFAISRWAKRRSKARADETV